MTGRLLLPIRRETEAYDSCREEFRRDVLPGIDCVILSPGPGSPDKAEVSDISTHIKLEVEYSLTVSRTLASRSISFDRIRFPFLESV